MTTLLVVLSILAAWSLLGVLAVGLLLVVKSLQSIRGWFQQTTVGLRAIEHQTADLATKDAVVTASLRETIDALQAASDRLGDRAHERA